MQLRSHTSKAPKENTTPKYKTQLIIVNYLPSAIVADTTSEKEGKVVFVTGKLSDLKP